MRALPHFAVLVCLIGCKTLSTSAPASKELIDGHWLEIPAVRSLKNAVDAFQQMPSRLEQTSKAVANLQWHVRESVALNPGDSVNILQRVESLDSAVQMLQEQSLLDQLFAAEPRQAQRWQAVSQFERKLIESEVENGLASLGAEGELAKQILTLSDLPAADRQRSFSEQWGEGLRRIILDEEHQQLSDRSNLLMNLCAAIDDQSLSSLSEKSRTVWQKVISMRETNDLLSRLSVLSSAVAGLQMRHRSQTWDRDGDLEIPGIQTEFEQARMRYAELKQELLQALDQL